MTESIECHFCERTSDNPKVLLFNYDDITICTDCGELIGLTAARVTVMEARQYDLEWGKGAEAVAVPDLLAGMLGDLRDHPDSWWVEDGLVNHPSGISILARWSPGYVRLLVPDRGHIRPSWLQRRQIWHAVQRWRARPVPAFWRHNPGGGSGEEAEI